MQKEQQPNEKFMPLTFGSIISFSPTDSHDTFIHVDGFVKDKVLIKRFDHLNSKLNYSKCLFQIYPAFINTYKKEAQTIKDPKNAYKISYGQKRLNMINNLQEKIVTEFNFNLETFKKVTGQPIHFGQTIQLLHIASNKFLSFRNVEADIERENYKIGLDEFSSDMTIFKFLPCYKHQKESEGVIYLDDSVYIATTNTALNKLSYIHLSNPTAIKLRKYEVSAKEDGVEKEENERLIPDSQRNESNRLKYKIEVNVSLESQTRLKINHFTNYYSETANFLECGDIIWLNHSELDATLVCVTEYKNKVFDYKVEFDIGSKITDNLKQFLGNTNGMWIIENSCYHKGGPIRWDQSYRFKHLSSGLYLSVQKTKKKGENKNYSKIILEKEPTSDNVFRFMPVAGAHIAEHSSHVPYVTKDAFVIVRHEKSDSVLQGTFDKATLKKKTAGDFEEGRLFANETKPCMIKYGASSEEAAFKLIKTNYSEVWETSFLISCFPLLTGFLETITNMNYKASSDRAWTMHILDKMKTARNCVRELDLFCKNEIFNNSLDQKYGETNTFRQKRLKEQFFIDVLTMILAETVNNQELKLYEQAQMKKKQDANIDYEKLSEKDITASKNPSIIELAEPKSEKEKMEDLYLKFIDKKVKFCQAVYSLLVSICKGNYENELYTFQLIPKFLIHCKYIPEAVECIISIIGDNETILNKMSENLKMDIDKNTENPFDAHVINIMINIKDSEKTIPSVRGMHPSFFTGGEQYRVSKPVNLINFFLSLLKQKNEGAPNPHYLAFFRKICTHNKIGVAINQDIIFRILKSNPNFTQNVLISFKVSDKDVMAEFPSDWSSANNNKSVLVSNSYKDQESVIDGAHTEFLEEQLKLYSDLTLSRNYLWRAFLEKRFPLPFIFDGIWNSNFSKTMRAALCMLALTVYIDHEPFNQLNLPNMCRIYKASYSKKLTVAMNPDLKRVMTMSRKSKIGHNMLFDNSVEQESSFEKLPMEEQLPKLVENIVDYLEKQANSISKELKQMSESNRHQTLRLDKDLFLAGLHANVLMNTKDYLDDVLLLNVVQLFSKLIKFDILRMTGKSNLYYTVVNTLVRLLEYEPKSSGYSYLLGKLRGENMKKREESAKSKGLPISVASFKNFIGSVVENVTEITGTLGGFLNLTQQKSLVESKKDVVDDIEDQNLFNNPIMRTMMSLHYQLERLKFDEEKKDKVDAEVKLEVLETLDFLLDMRKNFLVSNFLGWHKKLKKKMIKYTDLEKRSKFSKKLTKRITESLPEVLPPISKTGFLDIDQKYAAFKVEKKESLFGFGNLMKNVGLKDAKKFTKFVKDEESVMLDLDTLLLGKESDQKEVTSDLLPSLLVTFLTTKNSILESRALDVIMRLFNQRQEMLEALTKLEILFDEAGTKSYLFVEKQSARLKDLVERLEIWLDEFIEKEDHETELQEVSLILDNFILLLNPKNQVENDVVVKNETDSEEVSVSRQNIMMYLRAYKPVLTIARDGLLTLDKVILDEEISVEKKHTLVGLFNKVHQFLRKFCKGNDANQNILAEYREALIEHARLDVGQIDVLCEIYDGNRTLCESVPQNFIDRFISLIQTEGRQVNFLKFFMVIQKCKDSYILENQIRVFRALINNEQIDQEEIYKILYSNPPKGHSQHIEFQLDDYVPLIGNQNLIDKLGEFGFRDTYRDEPFIYHEQLLDVFIETMKGTEGFNMNKAKLTNLFSFGYLMELLVHPDTLTSVDALNIIQDDVGTPANRVNANAQVNLNAKEVIGNMQRMLKKANTTKQEYESFQEKRRGFSKLKKKLTEFVVEIYLNTNSKVNQEVTNEVKHFVHLVEVEIMRLEAMNESTFFEPTFLDYLFEGFLGLCNNYVSKFLSEAIMQETGRRQDNLALYNLANILFKKLPLFEEQMTSSHMKNLGNFLANYLDDSVEGFRDKFGEMKDESSDIKFISKRTTKAGRKSTRALNDEDNEQIIWNSKGNWERLLHVIEQGETGWEQAVDSEKRALSQAILNFSRLFSPDDLKKFKIALDPKDLIKKFINYLQYGFSNKAKKETMISTLQILIKMIDVEDPDQKLELQNMLDKYDATKMFLTVLSDSSNISMDPEVLNSFLELGIKLLEGGNTRIQKNIYNYCITFQKSEALFAKFYAVITTFSNRLKRQVTSEGLELDLTELAEDYSNLGPVILENTLRLLQLFTEGHYTDLQNYVRFQTNSRNSYDMVAAVTELLRSYLNHMNQANYESIMRCLDTLAEFVQGPCPENQMSLIDGKFFEVVNSILTYSPKNDKDKFSRRSSTASQQRLTRKASVLQSFKQGMDKWMISRLKYKTLVLILSLLEMRKDTSVIKRILRSLPVDVVKKNLAHVWKVYKSMYGTKYVSQSLGHHEGDPIQEKKEKKKNAKYGYYDLITEAGFAAYFLLENYYEVLDIDDDRRILREVRENKKQPTTKKENLIQASVFGQIGSFLISIIKQGLDTAESLKNQINKNLSKLLDEKEEKKMRKEIEYRELLREGLRFFAQNSAHIEVVRNRQVEKVYFHLHPFCHSLPKEIKNDFNDSVNRVSVQSKVYGLTESSDQIIKVMKHEHRLKLLFNKYKVLAMFANHVTLWQDLSFTIALIVNFFILTSYSSNYGDEEDPVERRLHNPKLFLVDHINAKPILSILGVIMLISTIFVVLFYLFKKAPLVMERVWNEAEEKENQSKKKGMISRLLSLFLRLVLVFFGILQNIEIVYYIIYLIMAALAVIIHPFFFAFHLTETILRYPTLKNVIRAFWDPRKALGLALVLFIILEYIASLVGFTAFSKYYEGNCETTLDCFLYTFDFTFKANGGIGGQLDSIYERPAGSYGFGRFLFDNLINLFLVVVMISIVAGIIIDTFASLREDENEKNIDIKEHCFVCGNEKETFDRRSDTRGGFVEHIKIDHYMWNYVFYLAYLKSKDQTDYTGIESYISEKVEVGEVSWFPLGKALVLEDIQDEEEQEIEQMEHIERNIEDTLKLTSKFNQNLKNTLKELEKK